MLIATLDQTQKNFKLETPACFQAKGLCQSVGTEQQIETEGFKSS